MNDNAPATSESYSPAQAQPSAPADTSSNQGTSTPSGSNPNYVTPDYVDNSYRSLHGTVTKTTQQLQSEIAQLKESFNGMQPILNAFQNVNRQPEIHPTVANPLGALQEVYASVAELKQQLAQQPQMQAEFNQKLSAIKSEALAGKQLQEINSHFGSDPSFTGPNGKDNLNRVMALATTVHKEQFAKIYEMNGANAVQAMDTYVTLLKNGKLPQSPQTGEVSQRLNTNHVNQQKLRIASMGNPSGGYMGSNGISASDQIYKVGSVSF